MKLQFLVVCLSISVGMLSSCGEEREPIDPIVTIDPTETDPKDPTPESLGEAPDFSISTWDNEELNFETYKDKLLVIFFFGNTCPPCIGVGPEVEERLHKDLSDKSDYDIIGIDQWDGNDASVEGFKLNTGIEFPLGVKGSPVAKEYGTTYDRLVVVSKEGNIIYRGDNIVSNHIDEVVTLVNSLLD